MSVSSVTTICLQCSATHLFHIELIVACGMSAHSCSVAAQSCWILAGIGTRCRTCQSRASTLPGSRPWPWACQLHAPSKLATSVALRCIIKLHILEWPFIAIRPRHTYVLTIPFNQHPDMQQLSAGWIILAKEKCALTEIQTNLWTQFERNISIVYAEKVLDLLFQLVENGSKNKSVAFIFLFSVHSCS